VQCYICCAISEASKIAENANIWKICTPVMNTCVLCEIKCLASYTEASLWQPHSTVLYLLNVPEHPYKAKAIRYRTCHPSNSHLVKKFSTCLKKNGYMFTRANQWSLSWTKYPTFFTFILIFFCPLWFDLTKVKHCRSKYLRKLEWRNNLIWC
jgi:hypothetical protein